MTELNPTHSSKSTPPLRILPVLEKLKTAYLLWFKQYQLLPKAHRYSLGQKTDCLFIEVIEAVVAATFLPPLEKHPWVRLAIRKVDTIKVLLLILWEAGSLETQKYAAVSVPLDEIGRILGGWNGQIQKALEELKKKQNSHAGKAREK